MQEIELNDYREVIALFPTITGLAKTCGVPFGTAMQWKCRNRIPPKYWRTIIKSLPDHGVVSMSADVFLDFEER